MTIPGQPVWHLGLLRGEEDIIPHGARSNFGKNMPKPSQNRNIPGNFGTHWTLALIARKLIWEPLKQSKSVRRLLHITWMVTQQFLGTGNRRSLILKIGTSSVNVIFVFSQIMIKSRSFGTRGTKSKRSQIIMPWWNWKSKQSSSSQLPIIRADTLTLSWNLKEELSEWKEKVCPFTTLLLIFMLSLSMWACRLVGLTFRGKACCSFRNNLSKSTYKYFFKSDILFFSITMVRSIWWWSKTFGWANHDKRQFQNHYM